jgi:hypothetical protein
MKFEPRKKPLRWHTSSIQNGKQRASTQTDFLRDLRRQLLTASNNLRKFFTTLQ